jgi:hypothetical protein
MKANIEHVAYPKNILSFTVLLIQTNLKAQALTNKGL